MEFPSINDSCEPSHTTRAPHIPSSPRVPLLELPASLNKHVHAEGTWKRFTRTEVGLDVVMCKAVGEKRNAESTASQIELPKNKILVEASYQPCQKQ